MSIFLHIRCLIRILGILKTGKKCVKLHKRSLLHSFERPRRNIDSFVLDVLKTGTSAKDSGAAYNLFYRDSPLYSVNNSFGIPSCFILTSIFVATRNLMQCFFSVSS